ncbi:hypothetical protein U5A82_17290 [Sphingobium sp. CR2-8]|uniref:hypothetical protein n=1 Tax=Sphingobium sp. CR2-8 TaxID=1306534 RepID=UPI002DBC275B|nr:hypothetical protein [Sphingobium sp. CR2-8]MEC3912164.1 hypothetical protein [Sphingobium sp. CR2-8]
MTGNIRTTRPARAAIAAVLALTATPLLAQTAPVDVPTMTPDVTVPTPPVAPATVVPTPAPTTAAATPQFAPSQPVVQQTVPVEERIAAATAAVEAEQAAAPVASPRGATRAAPVRAAERPATAPRPAAMTPAAPAPTAPAAMPAPSSATPMAAQAPAAAPIATATPTESVARTDQALLWALGGGALLLMGLGGAALMRRRRRDEDVQDGVPAATYETVPAPVAAVPMAAEPAPRPAYVPATSHRLSEDATLEAMVAAAPSADNPFRTRAKRLRRAQHLIAQRQAAMVAAPAPQTMHAEPVAAPAIDRSQTVYRFGNQDARSGFLKPRTR